jgi:CheY-like chemotaxis protein
MRILLVDDDTVFAELLRLSLSEHGFENVVVAHSARMALTEVERAAAPFDCFLLDIIMEQMDGIELCAALRKRSEYRAVPIIMLTSSKAAHHMTRAFEAGATDFLKKPLDLVDMVGRINAAMMLVEATKKEKRGRMALRAVIRYASDFNLVDLRERVAFEEIKGMVDYYQIENEILRLEPGYRMTNVFSIRLKHFQRLFRAKERGYILQLLHEISVTISETIAEFDFRFCYVGYGTYEVVQYDAEQGCAEKIQSRLKNRLHQTVANLSFIWSQEIRIEVVLLSTRKRMNRDEVLTILETELKSAERHDSFVLPEIRVIEDQLFEEIAKLEKEYGSR